MCPNDWNPKIIIPPCTHPVIVDRCNARESAASGPLPIQHNQWLVILVVVVLIVILTVGLVYGGVSEPQKSASLPSSQ